MKRHSRAHIRLHRDRVVAKRYRQARRVIQGRNMTLAIPSEWERWYAGRGRGELENEQAWLGCRRAHCGICHADKHERGAERQRSKRQWQRLERAAY